MIMAVEPEELRGAMRGWATGVTVVTTQHEEVRHGMTVSAFTSLSLEPPRVLISLARASRTRGLVEASGVFGVTVLGEGQEEVSNRFAGRETEDGDRFENLETQTLETGAPLLAEGLVFMDCKVVSSQEVGTSTIYIGEVVAVKEGEKEKPLLYFDGGYRGVRD